MLRYKIGDVFYCKRNDFYFIITSIGSTCYYGRSTDINEGIIIGKHILIHRVAHNYIAKESIYHFENIDADFRFGNNISILHDNDGDFVNAIGRKYPENEYVKIDSVSTQEIIKFKSREAAYIHKHRGRDN